MILKPFNIIPDNMTFSSIDVINIKWSTGGDIMVAFQIDIYDNATNTLVHSSGKINNYSANYNIPSNTLENGNEYKFTITVFNSVNSSSVSDFKIFRCYDRPTALLDSDGYIRNQIASFYSTYNQTQGILLKYYKYILYDEFYNVIEQSDYLYDGLLQYTFRHILREDASYYVECIVVDQNDLSGTSEKIHFIADYIPPEVYFNLGAESVFDEPFVRLSWTTVRIIGETLNTPTFIDNEELDLRDNEAYFREGFSIDSDYTIKLWVDHIEENTSILFMKDSYSTIDVIVYDNKVHLYKKIKGVATHISSAIIGNYVEGCKLFIRINQIGKSLNIYSEVVN